MSFFATFSLTLLVSLVLGVGGWTAYFYAHASGSVVDRLAAGFRGSLTKFVIAVGGLASFVVEGVDQIAQMTLDPMWTQIQSYIDQVIPAAAHPWVAITALVAAWYARNRSLPKA